MTNAVASFGTILQYVGTPDVPIAELTNIGGIEISQGTVDVTSHDSTDRWKEFIGGLRDGGEFSCEGNYVSGDAGQQAASDHFAQDTTGGRKSMEIVFPDTSYWAFSAICISLKPVGEAPVEGALPFGATYKVSGKPVFHEVGS